MSDHSSIIEQRISLKNECDQSDQDELMETKNLQLLFSHCYFDRGFHFCSNQQ